MVRRYIALFVFGAVSAALTFGYTASAWQTDPIIALERGALDRWGKGDPGGYLELYATDVTYFDPQREKRVDGVAAMKRLLEPIKGTFKADGYEMIEPRGAAGGHDGGAHLQPGQPRERSGRQADSGALEHRRLSTRRWTAAGRLPTATFRSRSRS